MSDNDNFDVLAVTKQLETVMSQRNEAMNTVAQLVGVNASLKQKLEKLEQAYNDFIEQTRKDELNKSNGNSAPNSGTDSSKEA